MTNQGLDNRNQRKIIKRVIIKGSLILDTPTCLGSGDHEGITDMIIIRDSITNHALLTGSSLAGALRNYLHEYEKGYNQEQKQSQLSTLLFGSIRQDDDGDQSSIIINDSISSTIPQIELRDGVKINSKKGIAEDKAKYDLELLAEKTEFPLYFELLIDEKSDEKKLKELLMALRIILQGLEKGEISLGMKKQRGFGRCHVKEWEIWQFNLQDDDDRRAWLTWGRDWATSYQKEPERGKISEIKSILQSNSDIKDERNRLLIKAELSLTSPLLIRSGQDSINPSPDVVHLKSYRDGALKPVVSGTSLAGILRHRAEKIINTLEKPIAIIEKLFGTVNEKTKEAKASNLIVRETVIDNTQELIQNRIAIDRFTGGAYHGALFDEQIITPKPDTLISLELELKNPDDHEIGLLLLLLKDLWTSDLPLGGGNSIGRGRVTGKKITLTRFQSSKEQEWVIKQTSNNFLEIIAKDEDEKKLLEEFVKSLVKYVPKETNHE